MKKLLAAVILMAASQFANAACEFTGKILGVRSFANGIAAILSAHPGGGVYYFLTYQDKIITTASDLLAIGGYGYIYGNASFCGSLDPYYGGVAIVISTY